jgi:hypothetical protein
LVTPKSSVTVAQASLYGSVAPLSESVHGGEGGGPYGLGGGGGADGGRGWHEFTPLE